MRSETGPGGVGEEGRQLLEPKAINHDLASRRDGLAKIVGPKWGKLGAQRAPRVPDLQSLGRSSCRSGAWPGGFLRSDKASFLARVRLKCLGRKGNSSRKGALGSARGTPPELGKLSQVASQPPQVYSRSCCGWPCPPPCTSLGAAPAPSPAHCSCGSGRCLAIQHCSGGGVLGGGGDPEKAHSWEGRGEPRRCPHTASRICLPFLPFLSW